MYFPSYEYNVAVIGRVARIQVASVPCVEDIGVIGAVAAIDFAVGTCHQAGAKHNENDEVFHIMVF
jgi:hypothetical protein